MTIPPYWQKAKLHLAQRDPKMDKLIDSYPDECLINYHNPFYTLTRAIVGQQISVKAADKIWQRVESLIISPESFLEIESQQLRQLGLSHQKVNYLTNIAQSFVDRSLTPELWHSMSEQDITNQLLAIKGIGRWTAEMFLIFHLHSPNILPLSDLGLLNAIKLHYQLTNKEEILKLSQLWDPYCTVATWYLWRSLDPIPVQY
ncbi:MAG: DNA-3-methyladenine glycosylase 2 family protein [Cyanobacteriota bacterium ELA615]